MITRRKMAAWCLAEVVFLVAGCASVGSVGSGGGAGGKVPSRNLGATVSSGAVSSGAVSSGGVPSGGVHGETAASKASAPSSGSRASGQPGKAIWLSSLEMTSAGSGWALYDAQSPSYDAQSPSGSSPGSVALLARTTDGARTWTDVTPTAGRRMLTTIAPSEVLDPVDSERAYLAVTEPTQASGAGVNTSVVFATADGGRTWTASAPLRAAGAVVYVSFADARHGWLLLDAGDSATGQPLPWLFRTVDGGHHWSPVATAAPGGGGMNDFCQETGLTFRTASTGWLIVSCRSESEFLVSNDGGRTWATQPLPIATSSSAGGPPFLTGPQFTGGTGYLTVSPEVGASALLASQDLGQTWHQLPLPASPGQYPKVKFFGPADGVLVAAGSQEALGTVFYTTSDGGQTWTPVRQGTHFTQPGAAIDFASPATGFAWTNDAYSTDSTPPPIYVTANSGRTWQPFTPSLAS